MCEAILMLFGRFVFLNKLDLDVSTSNVTLVCLYKCVINYYFSFSESIAQTT